jgi:hypothetical protein
MQSTTILRLQISWGTTAKNRTRRIKLDTSIYFIVPSPEIENEILFSISLSSTIHRSTFPVSELHIREIKVSGLKLHPLLIWLSLG